jgi:hypothetical protein
MKLSQHLNGRSGRNVRYAGAALVAVAGFVLAACGGSNSNPLDNPPDVVNPPQSTGKKLSFTYFQRCVYPVLNAQLQVNINGQISTNSCASSGCHDDRNGTGGALRLSPATPVDVTNPANTPEVIRAGAMYRSFFSSQGETVVGSPASSRLLNKPLVRGVLHGGGTIFLTDNDPNAKVLSYWIGRPLPQGQDEFSAAANSMFTPPDPNAGSCNTD